MTKDFFKLLQSIIEAQTSANTYLGLPFVGEENLPDTFIELKPNPFDYRDQGKKIKTNSIPCMIYSNDMIECFSVTTLLSELNINTRDNQILNDVQITRLMPLQIDAGRYEGIFENYKKSKMYHMYSYTLICEHRET